MWALLVSTASACGADGDGEMWDDSQVTVGSNTDTQSELSPGESSGVNAGVQPNVSPPGSGQVPLNPTDAPAPTAPQVPTSGDDDSSDVEPSGDASSMDWDTPTNDVDPPAMPSPVTPQFPMPPVDPVDFDAGVAPPSTDPPVMPEPNEDAGTDVDPDIDDVTSMDGDEVPMTDHCAAVADWDPMWTQWEDEVLLLINDYRAMGFNCDSQGAFEATTPLASDPVLRCAARLHSLDMYERGYFDHDNPDGVDPFERMAAAGFSGSYMGENIAQGQSSPEDVMVAWMDSDGHCSNVMNPNYTLVGVGYHPGSTSDRRSQRYWTQNFGAPPRQGGGGGRR